MSSSVLILEKKNKVDSYMPCKAMAHSTKYRVGHTCKVPPVYLMPLQMWHISFFLALAFAAVALLATCIVPN
jgi:hypothetical protein